MQLEFCSIIVTLKYRTLQKCFVSGSVRVRVPKKFADVTRPQTRSSPHKDPLLEL